MKHLFVVLAAFYLSGCQAMMYGTASDLNKVSVGMSKARVLEVMGDPSSTSAKDGEEHLLYRRMKHTISWAPTWYEVVLRNGQVASYGEEAREPASK